MKRIIAIDPGGTTGWATWTRTRLGNEWACGQIGSDDHHNQLDVLLGNQHVTDFTIVCEGFGQYRDMNEVNLISLEYIGVVKRFAQERFLPVNLQQSQQGKVGGFVKRDNLLTLGLWYPSRPHAMDAYGHLLYFMLVDYGVDQLTRNEILRQAWK
jgi:hypothetical protein